jgi:hypothetical protein
MLSDIGIIKYGLNIFPLQEQLMYFVGSWIEIGKMKDAENNPIDMLIDYVGIDGKSIATRIAFYQFNFPSKIT